MTFDLEYLLAGEGYFIWNSVFKTCRYELQIRMSILIGVNWQSSCLQSCSSRKKGVWALILGHSRAATDTRYSSLFSVNQTENKTKLVRIRCLRTRAMSLVMLEMIDLCAIGEQMSSTDGVCKSTAPCYINQHLLHKRQATVEFNHSSYINHKNF